MISWCYFRTFSHQKQSDSPTLSILTVPPHTLIVFIKSIIICIFWAGLAGPRTSHHHTVLSTVSWGLLGLCRTLWDTATLRCCCLTHYYWRLGFLITQFDSSKFNTTWPEFYPNFGKINPLFSVENYNVVIKYRPFTPPWQGHILQV